MREGATTILGGGVVVEEIVAFRGERGSYNIRHGHLHTPPIVAFLGERGSYNLAEWCSAIDRDCSLPG